MQPADLGDRAVKDAPEPVDAVAKAERSGLMGCKRLK